ncbi:MAG: cupredoxin domain-containing protein, partial [Actinomycetota bacterium]
MQRFVRSATAVLATALLVLSVLAGPASAQATEISIIEFAYEPYDAVVELGTTVEWTNNGTATHTVTAADGSFDNLFNPGDTFSYTPEEAGQIGYFCRFHGSPDAGQRGFLTVYEEGAEAPEPQVPPTAEFTTVTATDDTGEFSSTIVTPVVRNLAPLVEASVSCPDPGCEVQPHEEVTLDVAVSDP